MEVGNGVFVWDRFSVKMSIIPARPPFPIPFFRHVEGSRVEKFRVRACSRTRLWDPLIFQVSGVGLVVLLEVLR